MAQLDHFLLPQDGRNSFSAPYRPSIFLCCILILLAAGSIIAELLTELLIFPIITYCPTIHFALQSIIRTRRQSHTGPESSKTAARRATVLAIIWIITEAAHVFFWYASRKDTFSEIYLNPVFPGSEAMLIMVYLAIRHNLHERVTRQKRIVLAGDDEENITTNETGLPASPPDSGAIESQEDVSVMPTEPAVISTYQPSMTILVASISLTVFIAVDDAMRTFGPLTPFLWTVVLIQAYLPTILFQLYIITRVIRCKNQSPEDLSGIAGICFEVTLYWIWARALFVFLLRPFYHEWAIPGIMETLLMVYLSARYVVSLSRAADSYRRFDHATFVIASEPTDTQNPSTADTPSSEGYHPSLFTLLGVLLLSGMCAYTEISNEPHIGITISVLVYAPTVAIFLHWTIQSFHRDSAVSDHDLGLLKYDRAVECAIGLFAIWILTQAFYVFLWPINRYYDVAMNPYLRWPAVALVGYVALRYAWDRYRRERIERGTIVLPPDIPQQEGGVLLGASSA